MVKASLKAAKCQQNNLDVIWITRFYILRVANRSTLNFQGQNSAFSNHATDVVVVGKHAVQKATAGYKWIINVSILSR